MAISEPLSLTRRTILTGAAALFAAGTAGLTVPRPARAAVLPQIRAAAAGWTGGNGELLVLTADPATETDYALRLLAPSEGSEATTAELGLAISLALPAEFHPHSMAALGSDLWITGAVERVPGKVRPALIRIDDATTEYAELPVPKAIRSGIATAIAPVGDRGLAVVIEGCPDPHLTAITRSHLALSKNYGRTWAGRPLASGLGEGYGTVLTESDHGLFLAVVDGDGTQTVHISAGTGALKEAASLPDAGRPMAAVAGADHVSVFSDRDGTVAQTRFTTEGEVLESSSDCGCRGEIHAVPGRRGTWLETDSSTIHIRSTD